MKGLADALLELWDSEAPAKRWSAMQYKIVGGKFDASFTHGPPDLGASTLERREHILKLRYGNKQVVYPPWDDELHGEHFDL